MSFYSLEIKQRSVSERSGPLLLGWVRVCPAAGADLTSQALIKQTQASKQNMLLFVAPHLPDAHLRAGLLLWAEAAGPQWRPGA